MKGLRVWVRVLAGTALLAGVVLFGFWNWSLHRDAEARLMLAGRLEAHDQFLRDEIKAGAVQLRALKESLRVATNRVGEVERQLEAEKKTHEPLRRQIEKMLAEQMGVKGRLNERDKTVVGQQTQKEAADTPAAPTVSAP